MATPPTTMVVRTVRDPSRTRFAAKEFGHAHCVSCRTEAFLLPGASSLRFGLHVVGHHQPAAIYLLVDIGREPIDFAD